MRCEVIAIGTELLLGQIVDSNSSWIGEHLALAGIDCVYQVKVGDNMGRMVEEMENQMRDALQTIYFGKTKTVVNGLYKAAGEEAEMKKKMLQMQLQAEMAK